MGISYSHAKRFVGQPVLVTCVGGRRCTGIVRHVTSEFLFLSPLRVSPLAGKEEPLKAVTAAPDGKAAMIEPAQFGFFGGYYPGFGRGAAITALALFDILAISLLWL